MPDLQYEGRLANAARAGLQIVRDYCDTGVSGRRDGRPQLNALMMAARQSKITNRASRGIVEEIPKRTHAAQPPVP